MEPRPISRRGLMLVLSSPSGAGKTTIARRLRALEPDVAMSVSATTRERRSSETDGSDYHFVAPDTFVRMVEQGELLEHALVFGNHYGTPRGPVEAALADGRDVLFDIDWQGTQQLAGAARDDLVSVFVLPPSTVELERRLRARNQDSSAVVARRMAQAAEEMSHYREYDYIIVNNDIDLSVASVRTILAAERLKRDRQQGLGDFVTLLREGG